MPVESVISTRKMANAPFCSLRKRLGCSLDTLVAIEKLDPPGGLKNWKTVRNPNSHQNLPSVGSNENLFSNYETILLRFQNYSKKRCHGVRRSASVLTERQNDEDNKLSSKMNIVKRSVSMCSTRDSSLDRENSWAKIAKGHCGQIHDNVENHQSAKVHVLCSSSQYGTVGNNRAKNGWSIHSKPDESGRFPKVQSGELADPVEENLNDNQPPSVLSTATPQHQLSSSCTSLPSSGATRNNVSVHARLKMTRENLQELGTMRTLQERKMLEVKLMVGRWHDRHKVVCKPESHVQGHATSRETCNTATSRLLPRINENLVNNTTRFEGPTCDLKSKLSSKTERNDCLVYDDSDYHSNGSNVTTEDDRGYHSNESLGPDGLMSSRSASPTTTTSSSTEIIKDTEKDNDTEKTKNLNDNNTSAKHVARMKNSISSALITTVTKNDKSTAIGKLDVKSPILSSLLNRSNSVYYGSLGRSKLEKANYEASSGFQKKGRFVQTAV